MRRARREGRRSRRSAFWSGAAGSHFQPTIERCHLMAEPAKPTSGKITRANHGAVVDVDALTPAKDGKRADGSVVSEQVTRPNSGKVLKGKP
jgi:hypothetical protein